MARKPTKITLVNLSLFFPFLAFFYDHPPAIYCNSSIKLDIPLCDIYFYRIMASRHNSGDRNVVPGTAPVSNRSLRIMNAEREAIFDKVKTTLPHGKDEREAAIATKFQDIDEMIAEISARENMSPETILHFAHNQSGYTMMHVAAEYGRDGKIPSC